MDRKHFGVYLTGQESNKTIELPVSPEEVMFPSEAATHLTDMYRNGQHLEVGTPNNQVITIETFIPFEFEGVTYTSAEKLEADGQEYIYTLTEFFGFEEKVRFVVAGTDFSMLGYITKWNYGLPPKDPTGYKIVLEITEYFEMKAIKISESLQKPKQKPRPKPPQKIGIGSTVIVNGRLHRDSYGSGPGQTESNATRKVNFMAKGRKCPYHVTTLDGGWRGWVTEGSVKLK